MIVYVNKLFIICLSLLVVCYSCRSKRETIKIAHEEMLSENRIQGSTSWMGFDTKDEVSRYWMFLSDSSFYFHPDEGLWGQVGKVAYIERESFEKKQSNLNIAYDSLSVEDSKLQSDIRSTSIRYPSRSWWWLLSIPIVMVGWLFWKHRRKSERL